MKRRVSLLVLLLLCLACLPRAWADDTSEIAKLLVPLMFVLIFVGLIICVLVTAILFTIVVMKS